MAYSLLGSIGLLQNASTLFRTRCVDHIEANEVGCARNLEASTANFSEFVPLIGYAEASRLANEMLATGSTWRDVAETMQQLRAARA
jgi:aspartate ammonia-lyase